MVRMITDQAVVEDMLQEERPMKKKKEPWLSMTLQYYTIHGDGRREEESTEGAEGAKPRSQGAKEPSFEAPRSAFFSQPYPGPSIPEHCIEDWSLKSFLFLFSSSFPPPFHPTD